MVKQKAEFKDFEEILKRKVTKFGNTGHVIVGKKHEGKTVSIVVGKSK